MPLNGFTSLCSKNAKQIVSRDKGNPQYHKANNVSNSEVTHYQIDGKVIKTGDRCDYLLMNEPSKTAYKRIGSCEGCQSTRGNGKCFAVSASGISIAIPNCCE